MKILIIYDSVFGNTEQIARAIAGSLSGPNTRVSKIGEVKTEDLNGLDLLIVGSPTRGFRATPALMDFLKALPAGSLKGTRTAAFDTRIDKNTIKSPVFRFIVHNAGYAAPKIGKILAVKGGQPLVPPEGFYVDDREGPLTAGELERAAAWIKIPA